MVNLIRKDLISLKWYFLFVLGYGLVFGTIATSPYSPLLVSLLPAIMLTIFVANIELRNKSMLFVGSLPVRRRQIVLAKYLSVFVYIGIGLALAAIMYLLNEHILDQSFPLTGTAVLIASSVALLFSAIYYPLYYILGSRNSSIISVLMIFLASALAGGLNKSIDLSEVGIPSQAQLTVGLPLLGLVLFYGSYRLSLSIFSRKDMEG
ncbi:ABC-2 transporter permease [Cohnella thailandensis]|uniref:ABC-2 transporter permease n=1 Tax=Cohnella thailandensis TaxID=557557 RepID=A0A841SPB3_9BACL|nr:ABC-2 transporter permease [Cohnella thailandensis]MBB6633032.1 ABC-2 transporter permease [Cohnella thailandensis]MBP1975273.1 ABC-2 type transport system permease protein [Cohnella thailandensis]